MTKYKRITGKVFGGNATATGDDPQIAQFGSALANTFIGTTDPEVIQQLPAWGQGWIGAVTPETQFPAMPEMTGAMKVLSHQICTILQEGISSWDSGTIYYDGNWVSKNGNLYKSLTDENQGNDPETDTTNWINLMALAAHAAMPSTRYIDLTIGVNQSNYTAPADGYFAINAEPSSSQGVARLGFLSKTTSVSSQIKSYNDQATMGVTVPVSKGDVVQLYYYYMNFKASNTFFRFIYAQGAQ